jgi:uncharacterized damage-inducible protein DinB
MGLSTDLSERIEPPPYGDELGTLIGFLDYQRATLAIKTAGLTPEQLAARPTPPSALSLLGLVRHLAEVERGWFRGLAGEVVDDLYCTEADRDYDFNGAIADPVVVAQAFTDWQAEIVHAREIVAATSLDAGYDRPARGDSYSMRWILVHMIEEYARHNGHADLLREAIDGETGE